MVRTYTISSGEYTATIKGFGAELSSLVHMPSGTEFIWQAEPVWPRHAPVLFPFVGRLQNFKYLYNGKEYIIEQHGFARDLDFNLISHSDDKLVLGLHDSKKTLEKYPFHFHFQVSYHLQNNKLTMGFEINNLQSINMPVSFGGHPAFNLKSISESYLEFEKDIKPVSWTLDNNFISGNTKEVVTEDKIIHLSEDSFSQDAMIFKKLKSDWICLKTVNGSYSIKVQIKDWPFLGIWAKPAAPFVCIEPWQGLADNSGFTGDVYEKEGIVVIPGNNQLSKSFRMEFNP